VSRGKMKFLNKRWGKSITTTVTLTPEILKMLKKIAEKEGMNRSDVVRQLIEHIYDTGGYKEAK